MSKAVTGYVIALILVIVVVVLVGYFLFFYYGGFGNTNKYTDCTAKKLRYCFELQSGGQITSWDSYAPGCTQAGVTPDCTTTTTSTS
jgi:hypothetical protein